MWMDFNVGKSYRMFGKVNRKISDWKTLRLFSPRLRILMNSI